MIIKPTTTPVSLQTFLSITDSQGAFKTWTDIKQEWMDKLPINEGILNTRIKKPTEIIGNNIIFENTENKNIFPFIDDLSKRNNKLTLNKMIMNLYSDYMIPLEVDLRDKKSCVEWSELISDSMSSMMLAKQDLQNMLVIDEMMKVAIALGNVAVIPDGNDDSFDFAANKRLGQMLASDRIKNRTKRTKFMKGYNKELERFLTSPTLSLNLLTGLTAYSAAADAYSDTKKRFEAYEIFGHTYESVPMYLGQTISMSEFVDDKQQTQNAGTNTGQCIKPFFFEDVCGLLLYDSSIAFYEQNFEERILPAYPKRMTDVFTIMFRCNVAMKPVYAAMNKVYVTKAPSFPSYTDLQGNVVPAMDLATKAGMDSLINYLYNSQPNLYNMFGWNGASNVDQGDVDKIWQKILNWKDGAIFSAKSKSK